MTVSKLSQNFLQLPLFQHFPPLPELSGPARSSVRGGSCAAKQLWLWLFVCWQQQTQNRFAAGASSWSYCAFVLKSQVLQSCLRRHWILTLAGSNGWSSLQADSSSSLLPVYLELSATPQAFGCVWALPGSTGIAGWCFSTWVSCSPAHNCPLKGSSKAENERLELVIV